MGRGLRWTLAKRAAPEPKVSRWGGSGRGSGGRGGPQRAGRGRGSQRRAPGAVRAHKLRPGRRAGRCGHVGRAGRGRAARTPPLRPGPAASAGAGGAAPERAEPSGECRVAGAPGSPCPPTSPWCPWRRGRTAARRRRRSRARRQARPRAASPTARAWVSAAAPARGTKAEARLRGAAGRWGRPGPEGRASWEEGAAAGRRGGRRAQKGCGAALRPLPGPAGASYSSLVPTTLPAPAVALSSPRLLPAAAPSRSFVVGAQGEGFRGGGLMSLPPAAPGPRKHLSPTRGGVVGEVRDALGSYGDGGGPLRERPQAPRVTCCDLHPRRGREGRSACLLPSRPPLLHCAPLALGQRAARQISCREDQPTALWGPGLEGQQVPAGRGKASSTRHRACSDRVLLPLCFWNPEVSGTFTSSWRRWGGRGSPDPGLLLHHLAPGRDFPRAGGWVT